MAAHGSGAAARSIRDRATVMNVDVGGGTSKIAICADGRVTDLTALDVGARLICLDPEGRIVRIEEAGRRFAADLGITLEHGTQLVGRDRARAGGADGGSPVRGHERRIARGRRRRASAPRPAVGGCRDRAGELLRRRLRIHLRPRGADLRRSRRAAGAGNSHPRRGLGAAARTRERRHPRHRHRRVAIHHAGERQHHLRIAARGLAAAQCAGDRADLRARRRRHRLRGGGRGDQGGASSGSISATAIRRLRCSCRGAARRRSSASTDSARAWSTVSRRCSPRAIRWCWRATATSAASWAFICARKCSSTTRSSRSTALSSRNSTISTSARCCRIPARSRSSSSR